MLSRNKALSTINLLALSVFVLCLCGCGPKPPAGGPAAPPPSNLPGTGQGANNEAGNNQTPVKDSLVAMLETDSLNDHVFPAGVKVQSVSLESGVATIDFSKEFASLANSGETVESDAQKELRKTLAKFSTIRKMRVTVDGKPFESQATDWTTPFPVRSVINSSAGSGRKSVDSASR